MKPDPTFWSKLIQDLRHEKGWSQRELAQFANVNRTTLRSIEHGTGPVKMDIFERLLDALGHDLVALPREIPLDPAPSTDSAARGISQIARTPTRCRFVSAGETGPNRLDHGDLGPVIDHIW